MSPSPRFEYLYLPCTAVYTTQTPKWTKVLVHKTFRDQHMYESGLAGDGTVDLLNHRMGPAQKSFAKDPCT